jgi:phospholipid transport system substrate-binding protein
MKIVKIFLFSLMLSISLLAIEEQAIESTMTQKIDEITEILQQKDMDKVQRDEKIINIIDPIFDFNLMGKLSLGKKTYKSISPAQKSEFITLFNQRIRASYIKKIDLYSDEKVVTRDMKKVKKTRIHLPVIIISKGEENELLYKFYLSKKSGWLVYDLDVLGVSIVQTYRQQFAEILQEHDFDELLKRLKNDSG